jgi:hypothetical protein
VLSVVSLAWADRLEVLGWDASPDFACRYLRVLEYEGSCGYDGAFAHLAAVEQGRAHADESVIVNGAGMDGDVMAYRHVVADMGRTCVEGYMHAAAVLDVRAVADGDWGYVATNDGIEPYGALIAHRYITHNRGILAKIAISPPFGSETAI